MVKSVLEVKNLTKDYPRVRALDNLSLEVNQGECFGLLGPNGAGKTTLMKILLNLILPSSGSVSIFGQPVSKIGIREQIGYLPERVKMYGFLKGEEFLDYQGRLYGMEGTRRKRRVEECLKMVGMYEDRFREIREYSKGMTQRIGLAQALLNSPSLLFLDEPAAGLDPISNKEMRDILLQMKEEGVTIFINSHLLSEIEMVCDRVAILHKGRMIKSGSKKELTSKSAVIEVILEKVTDLILDRIREVSTRVNTEGNRITLNIKDSSAISTIPEIIINNGGKLLSFNSRVESLEDIFYRLIKGEESTNE